MSKLYNLIITNIYLYICIIIVLVILTTILLIIISNNRKRQKIKDDFVLAEKIEEEIESEPKNVELENILEKMQKDMETSPEEVVRKFEEEQEEKAIISYQELVDNVRSGKIETVDDEEEGINYVEKLTDEPISYIEEEEQGQKVTPSMLRNAIESISLNKKEEVKPFKQSEFISPIYGRMEANFEYPTVKRQETVMDIMNTKDYNELTEEIKKQEEFLNALIEFRKNL